MVNNPLPVVAHPQGAEVIFTVMHIDLTDAEFDRDIETARADLSNLKNRIESGAASM